MTVKIERKSDFCDTGLVDDLAREHIIITGGCWSDGMIDRAACLSEKCSEEAVLVKTSKQEHTSLPRDSTVQLAWQTRAVSTTQQNMASPVEVKRINPRSEVIAHCYLNVREVMYAIEISARKQSAQGHFRNAGITLDEYDMEIAARLQFQYLSQIRRPIRFYIYFVQITKDILYIASCTAELEIKHNHTVDSKKSLGRWLMVRLGLKGNILTTGNVIPRNELHQCRNLLATDALENPLLLNQV
ncbi:hypothetical protein P170DRAFT_427332 [Aspergillus steynii IBT 23096]|uniref:Uncharacterized protein n=1 Tax=Aspergillus steynii IBT 23096 TaxID=1392250 RepID=A0A2I2G5R4_9EURO|nr:uncharacterized protein P170DRAFT_427332 [Aspergillus steynii IBT 23096]PLB48226.1 hypothetical protein P170DRAFT_427332 [Aspergillus steynii IBT 23096]